MEKFKNKIICPVILLIFGAQLAIDENQSMPKVKTNGTFLL